jgi:hypothetical protein
MSKVMAIIVCAPLAGGPSKIAGSRIDRCSRCRQAIHVAPSSFVRALTMCFACSLQLAAESEDVVTVHENATTEQLAELTRASRREVTGPEADTWSARAARVMNVAREILRRGKP